MIEYLRDVGGVNVKLCEPERLAVPAAALAKKGGAAALRVPVKLPWKV